MYDTPSLRANLATETLDQPIDEVNGRTLANLLTSLNRRIPGGYQSGITNVAETGGEFADQLDQVVEHLYYWSTRAMNAERKLLDLEADVAAFRRILGTAPVQS